MPMILDSDLERSWLGELVERITTDGVHPLAIDLPGLIFRARERDRWIEPRLMNRLPTENNLRVPWEDVVLQVRCFVKVEAKGERATTLSDVVDEVLRVVDPRRRTDKNLSGIIRVRDCDGKEVGILQCSPVSERRAYNQAINIRGDDLKGLDVAILLISCKLTSSEVCG